MADITATIAAKRAVVPVGLMGEDSDADMMEWGEGTFGATDDAAELALTYLDTVESFNYTIVSATGVTVADGPIVTDFVVTSGAITVARTAHADGATKFRWRCCGKGKRTAQ